VKIVTGDTDISLLIVKNKKEEITEDKIHVYSPFGKFAERAKQSLRKN